MLLAPPLSSVLVARASSWGAASSRYLGSCDPQAGDFQHDPDPECRHRFRVVLHDGSLIRTQNPTGFFRTRPRSLASCFPWFLPVPVTDCPKSVPVDSIRVSALFTVGGGS